MKTADDRPRQRCDTRALADAPPVDGNLVARTRAAIDAGRYGLDPDAIAAAMIEADLSPTSTR